MTLNNLKTVIAVATAFNLAACLVSESAQAQRATWSGGSINNSSFTFDLVDVQDQAPNDNSVGVFPGSIQNFNFGFAGRPSNSSVCGKDICPPGTLTVTKFSLDSSGNIPGINPTNYAGQNPVTWLQDNVRFRPGVIDFSNKDVDVLRYDVNFNDPSSEPDLIWFIQSNDSNLINNLATLIQVDENKIVGLYPFSDPKYFYFSFLDISGQFTSQQVPEPSIRGSLFSLGLLGTISLLKRNKRQRKLVTQRKPSSGLSQKST